MSKTEPETLCFLLVVGFPWWRSGKKFACHAGDSAKDTGSIPGQEGALEKSMATHSSILTWRIPWSEEPGRL